MGRQFDTGMPPATKSIVNRFSDGGVVSQGVNVTAGKELLSGALTAGTLKTLLSVSESSGKLTFVAAIAKDATLRQVGLKLTIDGVVVFNVVGSAYTVTEYGQVAVGVAQTSSGSLYVSGGGETYFNSSFVVEVSSTITETDKVAAIVNYEVF